MSLFCSVRPAASRLFFEIHKQDFEALSNISFQLLLQYFNTLSHALEALLDMVTLNNSSLAPLGVLCQCRFYLTSFNISLFSFWISVFSVALDPVTSGHDVALAPGTSLSLAFLSPHFSSFCPLSPQGTAGHF